MDKLCIGDDTGDLVAESLNNGIIIFYKENFRNLKDNDKNKAFLLTVLIHEIIH